jgi:hypothetical protein
MIWRRKADGSVAQRSSGFICMILNLLGYRKQVTQRLYA